MHPSFKPKTSSDKFNILVVDDDPTALSIVSALLKSWNYEAITVKSPVDALATVRTQHERIDLVLSDLHMPIMNGIELQKQIEEEFPEMPVIIMSSDDRESVILESLASGAVFYIVKPINPDDLKNVWQYAITSKKGKARYLEEMISIHFGGSLSRETVSSASSVNDGRHGKTKDNKRKASKKGKEYMEGENSVAPKKAKVVWTNSLHNRFLEAIRHIGLEKAVPKKILEGMNVPGLTRENVASHLQKYRLFLKRVAEKGITITTKNFSSRNVMSNSFAPLGQSSMFLNLAQQDSQKLQGMQPTRTSFQPASYGGTTSAFNGGNIGSRQGPSSSSVSQLGLQMENQANICQPNFGTTNPLNQPNRPTFGLGSNDFGNRSFSPGGTPGGLMNSANRMQMYPPQGIFNNLPPNYAGMPSQISQTTLNDNFLNGGCDLINPSHNENVNFGQTGSASFGYFPPGESSSNMFDRPYNPFQRAFAGFNQQESTQVLPPYGIDNGGQNNFTFDLMNNASARGNPQQTREGDISGILFGTTDNPFQFQQQVGEGSLNPTSGSGSNFVQANPPGNPSLNLDFSGPFCVEHYDPWLNDQPTLDQLEEIVEAINLNSENGNSTIDDCFLNFQQNEEKITSELHDLLLDNNLPENQEWDEEFLNSLFDDHPAF